MKLNKIPRQVIIMGFVSLFTDIASEMLYPITPIFLTSVLGASMLTVGLIEGLAEFISGFLKGYFGRLSDRLKRRSIFVKGGYALSAISKPLPGIFPFVSTVLFSRITDRIGKGMRTSPRDALLAANSNGNTGAIFGFHRGMDTLGAAIGPIIALMLLHFYHNNYRLIFIIAFIPSILAVSFTSFVKEKIVEKKQTSKMNYIAFWKSSPARYKQLILLIVLFSIVNSSDVFLILKSKNISHSNILAVSGYIFYNFIYAIASYPIGKLSDRFGKGRVFIFGLFIFSTVYFGFAVSPNLSIIWILFMFYGIYAASTEGITKAWVSDLITDEKRGTAIGLLTMLSSFAVMVGSFLTGILWDSFGSRVPFLFSSIISFLVAISFIFVKLNKK